MLKEYSSCNSINKSINQETMLNNDSGKLEATIHVI